MGDLILEAWYLKCTEQTHKGEENRERLWNTYWDMYMLQGHIEGRINAKELLNCSTEQTIVLGLLLKYQCWHCFD